MTIMVRSLLRKWCVLQQTGFASGCFFVFLACTSLVSLPLPARGNIPPAFVNAGPRDPTWVPFIANMGQLDEEVAYYILRKGATSFITGEGEIVYVVRGEVGGKGIVLREKYLDARNISVTGLDRSQAVVNWYRGSDPSMWRQNVPTFRSIELGNIYENIDVRLTARRGSVEKLFTIQPGGDVSDIKVRIEGAHSVRTSGTGELVVETSGGQVRFTPPVAYQFEEGTRCTVPAAYNVVGREYGFVVGKYNRTIPLVIDPLLASTYLGGKGNETAYAVVISGGDIIIAGATDSSDFPVAGETPSPLGDAFVARLTGDLTALRAVTFIGGSTTEGVRDMVADTTGLYVVGYGSSTDFPTTPEVVYTGDDLTGAFVVKLDQSTLRMTASTSFFPNVFTVARGRGDSIFIAGATNNPSFPDPSGNAFSGELQGGADAFVAKLSTDLKVLAASTLLGGEGVDIIYDLAVDDSGQVVASGVTNSAAFPVTEGAFDDTYNLNYEETLPWRDGFVVRLTPDLTELSASTYLGGGWNDSIEALALDGSDVILGGNTASADFPCSSSFGPVDGNDAFVVRLDRTLSTIRSCAVFGGGLTGTGSADQLTDIAVHPTDGVFATGHTDVNDFPTTAGAFLERTAASYFGAYIVNFTPGMEQMKAATLIHGGNEYLNALALNNRGDVIVAGDAHSGGFPVTSGALQPSPGGRDDLIVSRFSADLAGPHIELTPDLIDFGEIPAGTTSTRILTLYNTGGAELAIKGLKFLKASSPTFEVVGICKTIPAFQSCQVGVSFTPVNQGTQRGILLVHSDDLFNREKTVELTGKGIGAPNVKVERDFIMFKDVNPGRVSSEQMVAVSNAGTSELIMTDVYLTGPDSSDFILGSAECTGALLGAGETCRLTVQFAPTLEGARSARIEVLSNDPVTPIYLLFLHGNASAFPEIEARPDPCEFKEINIGSTAVQDIRVFNVGGRDLYIQNVNLDGADADQFFISRDTCSGDKVKHLAADSESQLFCIVDISFAPASPGEKFGKLVLSSNDPTEPVKKVQLIGNRTVRHVGKGSSAGKDFLSVLVRWLGFALLFLLLALLVMYIRKGTGRM